MMVEEEVSSSASESLSELAFQMELDVEDEVGAHSAAGLSFDCASSSCSRDSGSSLALTTRWYLPASSGSYRRATEFDDDFSLSAANAVTPPGGKAWWHAFAQPEGQTAKALLACAGGGDDDAFSGTAGSTPPAPYGKAFALGGRLAPADVRL